MQSWCGRERRSPVPPHCWSGRKQKPGSPSSCESFCRNRIKWINKLKKKTYDYNLIPLCPSFRLSMSSTGGPTLGTGWQCRSLWFFLSGQSPSVMPCAWGRSSTRHWEGSSKRSTARMLPMLEMREGLHPIFKRTVKVRETAAKRWPPDLLHLQLCVL